MSRRVTARRWFAFGVATSVLLTGLLLLSSQAAGTGLAPEPGPDEATPTASPAPGGDAAVVNRLDTWAETKGKKNVSPAKGGGKNK